MNCSGRLWRKRVYRGKDAHGGAMVWRKRRREGAKVGEKAVDGRETDSALRSEQTKELP